MLCVYTQYAYDKNRRSVAKTWQTSKMFFKFSILFHPDSDHGKQQILYILEKISALKPHERLLLYLRMPNGSAETGTYDKSYGSSIVVNFIFCPIHTDPLRQSQNPLGTRHEINHTIQWVKTHLEHDPNVSIPKQDVYDDYV